MPLFEAIGDSVENVMSCDRFEKALGKNMHAAKPKGFRVRNQPFGPELALILGMEDESTREILRDNLEPTPAYNADVGASASATELEKGEKWEAQPHVDPFDPSPLVAPTSAEPDCVARANANSLKDYKPTDSRCLDWATKLPGILYKINSGIEDFSMPDCAHDAHKNLNFTEDSNHEHEV
ncbi:hypothetical protein B0H13DRAFT_2261788 [Mycena leptocephala]|nr:hypothetical protein B0H13DRAFT_2261788 [Mycena leptocephala]